jgi:hypothetical protein
MARRVSAGDSLVGLGLRREKAFEGRNREFAGIPRMVRADLRVADVGRQPSGEPKDD